METAYGRVSGRLRAWIRGRRRNDVPRPPVTARDPLSNAFFHDVLNAVGTISGAAELLAIAKPQQQERLLRMIVDGSRRLSAEIRAHWDLVAAESGELVPVLTAVSSLRLLRELAASCAAQPAARGREIRIADAAEEVELVTDRVLVVHVLAAMVKNALEAERPGAAVTLGCRATRDGVRFEVHNPGHIAERVQAQLFKLPISTKGPKRGLGLRAMRLIGEDCLAGAVSFRSTPGAGTTFALRLPRQPPTAAPVARLSERGA